MLLRSYTKVKVAQSATVGGGIQAETSQRGFGLFV